MNNPILNLFKYTFKYSGNEKWRMVLSISLHTIAHVILLANPWIVARIFNNVQFSQDNPQLLRFVVLNLLLLLAVNVAFWIINGFGRVLERRFHFKIRKNYKQDMFEKVLALPIAWHKDHHSGDTIDKINTAGQSLYIFSGRTFFLVQIVVNSVGSMIALLFFDWRASLIAFATACIVFLFMFRVDKWLQKRYKKLYAFENRFASAIHDYITNITTIITLKLNRRVITEIDRRGLAGYPTHHKVEFVDETKWVTIGILIAAMTVLALTLNAVQSSRVEGAIIIGSLFALYGYLQNVGNTFYNIAYRYGEIVRENTAIQAAHIIEEAHDNVEKKQVRTLPQNWKRIVLSGITFTYDDHRTGEDQEQKTGLKQLNNISLDIARGQRIALIGESGSGKSTLLALLRGLYEASSADVVVDGVKMKYGLHHLYQHITLVPQEPEIFNSTIEDNMTMEMEIDQSILDRAIDLARFRSVLNRLPNGLQTNVLEKGVSLSGGEKQRLALARGILAAQDSDILFLDEPTSSVDALNETQIYDNIFSTFKNKTIISTIHRLYLLEKFDVMYQFENGQLIASGTLDEMKQKPKFKELWNKYMSEQSTSES
jgi:ABC-type multidrug transport system fused ATPase/permease subunit